MNPCCLLLYSCMNLQTIASLPPEFSYMLEAVQSLISLLIRETSSYVLHKSFS